MREIVRRFTSNTTHLADIGATTAGVLLGAPYRRPPSSTRTLCGVAIPDGVVMREGTRLKCRVCRTLAREGR